MALAPALLLVGAAGSVGILHTIAPDHWAPIALLARQRGWSPAQTARAAAGAGLGHTVSTLAIGLVVWLASAAVATRFARSLNGAAGLALVGFGLWIAVTALAEVRHRGAHGHAQGHQHFGHSHLHRHADGIVHTHWHEHHAEDWHVVSGAAAISHEHAHATSARMALMLILGSSPSVEVLPAFSAAAPQGLALLAVMAAVFAVTTIGTYVGVCAVSSVGIRNVNFGPLERYGEVLSGLVIALVGIFFLLLELKPAP